MSPTVAKMVPSAARAKPVPRTPNARARENAAQRGALPASQHYDNFDMGASPSTQRRQRSYTADTGMHADAHAESRFRPKPPPARQSDGHAAASSSSSSRGIGSPALPPLGSIKPSTGLFAEYARTNEAYRNSLPHELRRSRTPPAHPDWIGNSHGAEPPEQPRQSPQHRSDPHAYSSHGKQGRHTPHGDQNERRPASPAYLEYVTNAPAAVATPLHHQYHRPFDAHADTPELHQSSTPHSMPSSKRKQWHKPHVPRRFVTPEAFEPAETYESTHADSTPAANGAKPMCLLPRRERTPITVTGRIGSARQTRLRDPRASPGPVTSTEPTMTSVQSSAAEPVDARDNGGGDNAGAIAPEMILGHAPAIAPDANSPTPPVLVKGSYAEAFSEGRLGGPSRSTQLQQPMPLSAAVPASAETTGSQQQHPQPKKKKKKKTTPKPLPEWNSEGVASPEPEAPADPIPAPVVPSPVVEVSVAAQQAAEAAEKMIAEASPPGKRLTAVERARREALAAFGGMDFGEVTGRTKAKKMKRVMTMKDKENLVKA